MPDGGGSTILAAGGTADEPLVNADKQQIQPKPELQMTGMTSVRSASVSGCFESRTAVAVQGECAGAIPYRVRNGVLEVLLITSRGTGRWIIPKGHMEEGLSSAKCAALEAFEEGGVVGAIHPESAGSYLHCNSRETQRVRVHLLRVETTLAQWPEQLQRQRLWSPFEYAASRVEELELRQIVFEIRTHL